MIRNMFTGQFIDACHRVHNKCRCYEKPNVQKVEVVRPEGFEPTTSWSEAKCSIH